MTESTAAQAAWTTRLERSTEVAASCGLTNEPVERPFLANAPVLEFTGPGENGGILRLRMNPHRARPAEFGQYGRSYLDAAGKEPFRPSGLAANIIHHASGSVAFVEWDSPTQGLRTQRGLANLLVWDDCSKPALSSFKFQAGERTPVTIEGTWHAEQQQYCLALGERVHQVQWVTPEQLAEFCTEKGLWLPDVNQVFQNENDLAAYEAKNAPSQTASRAGARLVELQMLQAVPTPYRTKIEPPLAL